MAGRRAAANQAQFTIPEPDADRTAPLAARMRPRELDEFVGQDRIVGKGSLVRSALDRDTLPSIILWGPPGCGKTTLARILARELGAEAVQLSAVAAGVADLRRVIEEARARRVGEVRTVLFIDEIHRFNKAQQDVILPAVEDGAVILIGATTENPSFEVVAPLLSRVRVLKLQQLSDAELGGVLKAALQDPERGLGSLELVIEDDAREALVGGANGDARAALTALEIAATVANSDGRSTIAAADVHEALQERRPYYDKGADFHYDTVSAFIKSLRGSDPDAALYWLARMVDAGEDPLFIVRRMVILASEDIGLADPQALAVATSCQQAVHFVGLPEGFYALAQCALYLALAPKSNSVGSSYQRAMEDAVASGHLPVPMHLRNAATGLMRDMGYGKGYRYAHSEPGHIARGETYLPGGLSGRRYFEPGDQGVEPDLVKRVAEPPEDLPQGS